MIKVGLKGRFRLEVREAETDKLKQVREFDNLITNRGLDGYGYGYGTISSCCVGTGTNAPTVNDTILGNQLAVAGNASRSQKKAYLNDNNVYESWANIRYRFNVGTATGNLTEVGICNGKAVTANDYVLWSRALILNENNEPTALPVLENEYLDVYYTLYMYPDMNDTEFSFMIDDIEYNAVARAAWIQNSVVDVNGRFGPDLGIIKSAIRNDYNSNTLGELTQSIQGATKSAEIDSHWWHGVGDWLDYTPGTFYRDNYYTMHTDMHNIDDTNGIRGLVLGAKYASDVQPNNSLIIRTQVSLDKPIMKTQWNAFKLTLRHSWGRYEEP